MYRQIHYEGHRHRHGQGIYPKIFESFSQEDATTTNKYGGSGLGMAITKNFVEMMNGSVSVESEKGVGTEFTVILTFRNCGQKEYDQLGEIDTNALYILVVDDNPIEAEHTKMVLKEVGISADSCTSGQEALRKMEIQHVRKHPYNIVLMDWNMPIMNGMETSAEILRLYKKESIVAAMTAYSWDDISSEAHSVGVEDFVEKPLFTANIIGNIKVDHAENGKAAVELFEKKHTGHLFGNTYGCAYAAYGRT